MLSIGRYEEAVIEARKAVALDGNDAEALAGLANALVLAGRPDEGLTLIKDAIRLDPRHPPSYLTIFGAAEFGMGRYEEAVLTFKRVARRNPDDELPLIYLASSYGHLGQIHEAENTIETANDLRAILGLSYLSMEKSQGGSDSPFVGGIDFPSFGTLPVQARFRAGLSKIPALTWQYLIIVRGKRWVVSGSKEIDIATAKSFHDKGVVFIDMSQPDIWNKEHIPGAVNLPASRIGKGPWMNLLKQTTLQEVVSKNEEVVFYRCEVYYCGRGEGYSARAVNWGYKKVYFLVNGTITWKMAGYPVDSNQ
jgi:rhodanese-related sulfurtransferase